MKRTYDRVPLSTTFRFRRCEDGDAPFVETGLVHGDVSAGGAFVPTKWWLPEETVIDVEFSLPRRVLPMQLTGRVVWGGAVAKGTGMGVEFRRTSPRERVALRRYAADPGA